MSLKLSQPWTGRDDGPGSEHARWHNTIETLGESVPDLTGATALLGFASDEGVQRNKGRVGAADGPEAIRSSLGSLARHTTDRIVDAGSIHVDHTDLESAQEEYGRRATEILNAGGFVIGLGGGHEITYASYCGLANHISSGTIGIINIDAHFDLRDADRATSGTGFSQIAHDEKQAGRPFHYAILGVSRPNNTAYLFEKATSLGVDMVADTELIDSAQPAIDMVENFARKVDHLYLTIDLDALPAEVAPGVSAPATLGVSLATVFHIMTAVKATGKLRIADIAEYNPRFDIDARTARIAARLTDELTNK